MKFIHFDSYGFQIPPPTPPAPSTLLAYYSQVVGTIVMITFVVIARQSWTSLGALSSSLVA